LARQQEKIAAELQSSKEKDDRRGASVISDYTEAHPPASEDGFVQETQKLTEQMVQEIEGLIQQVQKLAPSTTV
jgi:hypothetical protein